MRPDSPSEATRAVCSQMMTSPRWLCAGFWISIVIGVAVAIRRLIALAYPSQATPSQFATLDAVFASHAVLTVAHIVPAMVFVLLAPLFYWRRFAEAVWPERLLFSFGAIVAITAYAMSVFSVGGWMERSAVLFFNSFFLFCLARSYGYMRHGQILLERRWMTRAIGILLGISTTRPIMGIFFATTSLTHLEPKQFFGIAFWIGFSINTVVVELWLRSQKRQLLNLKDGTGA
jgi:hypothetical protein